jgi:VWFA-related protein
MAVRRLRLFISLLVLTLFWPAQSPAQEREQVELEVQVFGKKTGDFARGLRKEHFEIFEDGVKQQIVSFDQNHSPLSILVLLDVSKSMNNFTKTIRESSAPAWQTLRPEDELAVIAFAGGINLLQPFTIDKRLIPQQVETAYKDGGLDKKWTDLNEAMYRAADYLRENARAGNRRIILAISDNVVNQQKGRSYKEAIQRVFDSGVTVYGLFVSEYVDSIFAGRDRLDSYVNKTGGIFSIVPPNVLPRFYQSALKESLIGLLEVMRGRYQVAYVPTKNNADGKFRKIEVKLTPEAQKTLGGARVLNRQGYYALRRSK